MLFLNIHFLIWPFSGALLLIFFFDVHQLIIMKLVAGICTVLSF